MRRCQLILTLVTALVSIVWVASAQAIVVDMNDLGHSSVTFNGSHRSDYTGVAMAPGTEGTLATEGIPHLSSGGTCEDPALPSDLVLPPGGLCWHGGDVMHRNETFAFTWDPLRRYWQTTRDFVEQFLNDVSTGSGTFTSPYAITGGYSDGSGRAANASLYGGGCIDFGGVGGSACKFGNTSGTGAGHDYPFNDCNPTGTSYGGTSNDTCVTDADIRGEVKALTEQTGMLGRVAKGYTPLVVVLMPTGVETCLDSAGTLCSTNSSAPAQFCSYHSAVNVDGTEVAYSVQPWTPYTACDEPDVPTLPAHPTAQQIGIDAGRRLVSPLTRSDLGALVNPGLDGWFAQNGDEIGDNGCLPAPLGSQLDRVTVGASTQNPYWIQREFDNSGLIQSDPNSPECADFVILTPAFVLPTAVNPGDVVDFDGSATASSMIVPRTGYAWNFGDGTTAIGPSVTHVYKTPGSYSVKLTVTDRGGNVQSLSQQLTVLGHTGGGGPPPARWRAHIQLLPQGFRSVLHRGVAVEVTTTKRADGIATLLISRRVARRAHIKTGHSSSVVIGRGTVSEIRIGTSLLHLHVARKTAAKLKHVNHLELTVRLMLFAGGGSHLPVVAAGRY